MAAPASQSLDARGSKLPVCGPISTGLPGLQGFDHVLTTLVRGRGEAFSDKDDSGERVPLQEFAGRVQKQKISRSVALAGSQGAGKPHSLEIVSWISLRRSTWRRAMRSSEIDELPSEVKEGCCDFPFLPFMGARGKKERIPGTPAESRRKRKGELVAMNSASCFIFPVPGGPRREVQGKATDSSLPRQ